MSMPQIPKEEFRPSLHETIIDLMESIALEEIALSHLMNAEAEKIQYVVRKQPCEHEILEINRSVNLLMETIVMKEWILLKKLEQVLHIKKHRHHEHECEECEE